MLGVVLGVSVSDLLRPKSSVVVFRLLPPVAGRGFGI